MSLSEMKPGGRLTRAKRLPRVSPMTLLLAFATTLAVGLAVVVYVGSQAARPAVPDGSAGAQYARAQRSPAVTILNAAASVVQARPAELGFGLPGQVKEVAVDVGQAVQAGDTLATLATDDLQTRLDQANAALRMAELKLKRLTAVAPSDLEVARAAVAAARAAVDASVAKRQQLEAGPSAASLAAADKVVADAQANLQVAEAGLASVKTSGPSTFEIEVARLDVERAKKTVESATARRDLACGPAGDSSCGWRSNDVASAEFELRQANVRLSMLEESPAGEAMAAAQAKVESARKALASAEADKAHLVASPDKAELLSARSAEESARMYLASVQSKLAQMERTAAGNAEPDATTGPEVYDIALAQEEVRVAEMGVRRAQLALDGAVVKAPFAGVVTAVGARTGERVAENAAVVTMIDPADLRVEATIRESDVARLQPGQAVEVIVDALGSTRLTGRISTIAPVIGANAAVSGHVALIALDPTEYPLVAGMSANVDIALGGSGSDTVASSLLVPARAVHRQGTEYTVQVLVNGDLQTRVVRVGTVGTQYAEVVEGLAEGDLVLVATATDSDNSSAN